jgi:hypothetical protein
MRSAHKSAAARRADFSPAFQRRERAAELIVVAAATIDGRFI